MLVFINFFPGFICGYCFVHLNSSRTDREYNKSLSLTALIYGCFLNIFLSLFSYSFFILNHKYIAGNTFILCLKDEFKFFPERGKGSFPPFWHREASFYPILTLIPYIFRGLLKVFEKVKKKLLQLLFEVAHQFNKRWIVFMKMN